MPKFLETKSLINTPMLMAIRDIVRVSVDHTNGPYSIVFDCFEEPSTRECFCDEHTMLARFDEIKKILEVE